MNDWIYLDPDNRRNPPKWGLHCCRCMKKVSKNLKTEYISVEMHPEHPYVRRSPLGGYLIGKDCWNKIKNNIIPSEEIKS